MVSVKNGSGELARTAQRQAADAASQRAQIHEADAQFAEQQALAALLASMAS